MVGAFGEANHCESIGSAFLAFGLIDFGVEGGKFGIFERGGAREQIKPLKNEADFLVANVRERFFVVLRNVGAFEEVAAGTGAVETTEHVHEGGLAAAAGTHDSDEFAAVDAEAYAAKRMHAGLAEVVVFVDVFDADYRGGSSRTGCSLHCLIESWHGFHEIVSRNVSGAVRPE